jgi:dTDP-4-dehydrorhamnose 3,5-epimerase
MEEGLLIHNSVFEDSRGTFATLPLKFGEGKLSVLRKNWIQSNISVNPKKFTFRGLHFQVGEFAQSKLIKVITGKIIDFIVDIRPNSPNYLKPYEFIVEPNYELFVPKGFAHGYISLEDKSEIIYFTSSPYSPNSEETLNWKDINVNIQWPIHPIHISEKDKRGIALTQIQPMII